MNRRSVVRDIDFDKFADAISCGFPVITAIRTDEPDIEHRVPLEGISTSRQRRETRTDLLEKVITTDTSLISAFIEEGLA
jgi:hypothetical protein